MAFVYEVNGQRVEFEREPTERDIDEAARALRPAPKSQQQAPVEGAGGAAFGVYRPQGRRPETQQDREASKDMALQTVRGAVSNVAAPLGLPVDIANAVYNLPRTAQDISNRYKSVMSQLAGNEPQPLPELPPEQKIPGIGEYGMNFYNQLVPGPVPTSPQGQLAFAGGQALGAPIANKAIGGVVAAPRVIKQAGQQIGRGAMEGVTNPTYKPGPNTAFAEVGDTFYPNKTVEPFMKLTPEQQVQALPALEASQQPSSSLFTGFLNKAAQRLAPEGPKGGTLVPLEGQGVQAFTEQNVRDFFNKPSLTNLSGATGNIGGAVLGGLVGGVPGALAGALAPQYIKALELLAQRRLQGTAGLKPGFAEQLGAAQQTAGRLGLEGSMPQTPLLGWTPRQGGGGAAGPVNPTMYVGPTGEATTNLAGTQVNMNPGSMAVPTPAANAAMATTQAKAAGSVAPRTPAQPKAEWTLPSVAEHYAAAEQGSTNFGDTFNKAVAARKADLLKDAQKTGKKLTPQQAEDTAWDEIKAWRNENVEAFKSQPKPQVVEEKPAVEQNIPKVDPELEMDKRIWESLKTAKANRELFPNEQVAFNRITKKYGEDPFGTGDITGNPVKTVAPEDKSHWKTVANDLKITTPTAITKSGNKFSVNKSLFDEIAASHNMKEIDWSKVNLNPGEMTLKEFRLSVLKDVAKQFRGQYAPRETQAQRIAKEEAAMTPEQRAAQDANVERRLQQFNNPNSPLNRILSGKTSLEKPPKTEAPKTETPKVETTPEPTAAEKSAEAQRILEMIRNRQKGNKPSGTMEMKTADADGITRYGSEAKPVSIEDARIAAYEQGIQQTPHSIWTEVGGVKYNFRDKGPWGKSVFKVNKDGTAVEYYGNKTEGYKRKEYDKAGNMKGMPKTSPDQFPDFPGDILL